MWTQFMDMNSGGSPKQKWDQIYIEAAEDEAKLIFYNRFGQNPDRVSCTCCGSDYSISSDESLEQLTGYHRGCASEYVDGDKILSEDEYRAMSFAQRSKKKITHRYAEREDPNRSYNKYKSLDKYLAGKSIKVIRADEISYDDRRGTVPQQGYVWVD